jgi:Zinc knuckle
VKLANIHEQLAATREIVMDLQYANILLASLPACYEMRICALTTNADESGKDIDPSRVIKHISDDYDKCMLSTSNGKQAKDQAFIASTQHNRKDWCHIECFNCKKKGHMKVDCWAKGGGKEGQCPNHNKCNNRNKSKESTATAQENNEDIESWAVITADSDEDLHEEDMESWSLVDEDITEALSEDPEEQATSMTSDPEAELYDLGAS